MPNFIAVDLGASSGRVVNVHIDREHVHLAPVGRFATPTIQMSDGGLAWDFDGLLDQVRTLLKEATARCPAESVAVDSWALDYGLLDSAGHILGPVHAYRSSRTNGVMDRVCSQLGRARMYNVSGIQFLPFNTAYQLVAARETNEYLAADRLLMVPDLVNNALCGSTTNDITNASTTQLLDIKQMQWSDELVDLLDLRREILPDLHRPGTHLGVVHGVDTGVDGLRVVAAASHDTASAVAGTPLGDDGSAMYISCGTWALVGCELPAPITTVAARDANVTNEIGVDDSVRLLKNVTGLWLFEECRRQWARQGLVADAAQLVAGAERVPPGRFVIDPDDQRFVMPRDMPSEIAAACRESGQIPPETPSEVTRTILESLALKWRETVSTIERVAGIRPEIIHLIGGGAAIPLLGRLCASACERQVAVGPHEATVVGNAVVQAVAAGVLDNIDHGRHLVARTTNPRLVAPETLVDWDSLAARR